MKINYTVEAVDCLLVHLKVYRNDEAVFTKSFGRIDLPFLDYMLGEFVSTDEERLFKLFKIAHEQGENYVNVILSQEKHNEFTVE